MLKRLRRKKLVLAGGDFLLIIASFYLSYAIRHGAYINVLFSYTVALVFSVIVFISLFYIVDVYNLELFAELFQDVNVGSIFIVFGSEMELKEILAFVWSGIIGCRNQQDNDSDI